MRENKTTGDARFYLIYALIEGLFFVAAIAGWYYGHQNIAYLIGSLVLISLVGGTFLMGRVMSSRRSDGEEG